MQNLDNVLNANGYSAAGIREAVLRKTSGRLPHAEAEPDAKAGT